MTIFNGRRTVAAGPGYSLIVDDAPSATIQNIGPNAVEIVATATSTAPATSLSGFRLGAGDALTNVLLTDLFPGTSAPRFVWARAENGTISIVAASHV